MKIVKPLKLGVLHRSFEFQGRCFWTPTVLVFFSFDGQTRILTEIDMWRFCPAELGRTGILDQAMPKERAEVLVTGAFHAPRGEAVPAGQVRVQIGPVDKTLFVYGQRHWRRNLHLVWDITAPEPMTTMPIAYENAFGGPSYPFNPLGKGIPTDNGDDGKAKTALQPLPTVEDPAALIGSRRDRPRPASFGPLDMAWPQRHGKCGTYNDQWFQERFPGLADDIDWRFFNMAPEDQQLEGFFKGDETFILENMHPQKHVIRERLPALRPRCFITRNDPTETFFKEVDLKLDTVWLFPHALKGVLVYHGLLAVQSDTAKEIDHLLLAYEFQNEPPRPLDHYHNALTRRLDKETGGLAMLDESDLIGRDEQSGFAEILASDAVQESQGLQILKQKQKQRMENDIAAVRAMIAEQGLDPDETLPMPVESQQDLQQLDLERILTEAKLQRQNAEAQLEAQLKAMGMSKTQMLEKAAAEPAPRPSFSADQAIAAYRQLGIQDPDLDTKMALVESTFYKNYRQAGHAMPPVLLTQPQRRDHKKKQLLEAFHAGAPPPDPDLAGLDLQGMNLEGINLKGVFLEDANLSGACLRHANLEECSLMRSDLSSADLTAANLKGAGMGNTKLRQANLTRARMVGASLVGADMSGSLLRDAELNEADLSETKAHRTDLSGARLVASRFMEADLTRALFSGASLHKCLFYKTNLAGADFGKADLTEAVLVEANADGCSFRGANLSQLRAAFQCSMAGVDFSGAALCGCNFRGADLSGACFAGADLSGADFSETRLVGCDLTRIKAIQALFIEADLTDANLKAANLFESLLHKTTLFGTRFIGANLYGVDFMKARFRNTDVTLANTAKSTLQRWAP